MAGYTSIFMSYVAVVAPVAVWAGAKVTPGRVPKGLMTAYNVCSAVVNLVVFLGLLPYFSDLKFGLSLSYDPAVETLLRVLYISKYVAFIDSISTLLRHKWKKINVLQLYYHSTAAVACSFIITEFPRDSPSFCFSACASALVQALVYAHYSLAGFGIRNPLKKYIGTVQMVALAACVVQGIAWTLAHPEQWTTGMVQVVYLLSVVGLFYSEVVLGSSRRKSAAKKVVEAKSKKPVKSLAITVDGVTYDASGFAPKHPGGNVINFYDNLDATDAFQTFHLHSTAATKRLHALPVIKVEAKTTTEFRDLLSSWQDRGMYEKRYSEFLTWAAVTAAGVTIGYRTMQNGNPILGGVIVGAAWAHCGFVQHHAGHMGFSGNPSLDCLIQSVFECFLKGGSARWWRARHNKHHAMPNAIGYDGDLRTTPFFAWDEVLVKKVPTPLLKIQHLLFVPMLFLYVPVFFITTKLYVIRKRLWDEAAMIALHFYASSFFYTNFADFALFYGMGYGVQGLYLGMMFALSHYTMPRIDNIDSKWDSWQISTSLNWGIGSRAAEYLSGFLNLQIEHHVAPQMPAENVHLIVDELRAYSKKHNIPYEEYSFSAAVVNMIGGLRRTARDELARRAKAE